MFGRRVEIFYFKVELSHNKLLHLFFGYVFIRWNFEFIEPLGNFVQIQVMRQQLAILALITLFIDVLQDFVLYEDVAVERRPVRHVDFLLPLLVRDDGPFHGLGLFKQTRNVEF